ncbi:MAG TPA: ABC transporter ATP-binding protein [Candidatus Binataceae bacterium]|nr:ABC transporter ATP-binding protein [Candidatus Binataceae bacterium]
MSRKSEKISKRPLVRFLICIKPNLRFVVGAALMGIGKFTLPLLFPLAFKFIIDVILMKHSAGNDKVDWLFDVYCRHVITLFHRNPTGEMKLMVVSLSLLVLYAVQSVASYYRNYWGGIAGNQLIFGLQLDLFAHLQELAHSYFDRNPSGAVVSRILNDVTQAHELVSSALIDVWMDAISLCFVVFALVAMNWELALVALAIAPIWVIFVRYFAPRIKAVSHQMQEAVENISGEVHERVVGVATVKSFGREEDEVRQFRDRADELYEQTITKVKLAAGQEMLIQLLTRSAPIAVIWVGAVMILHGQMTLGTMVAFFTYLGFLYLPLERFSQLSVIVSASTAAIERIFSFLDIKPEITDHPLARPFHVRIGSVAFEHVSFAYRPHDSSASNGNGAGAMREVLRDVNLAVAGGQRVALVGRSGAGKTTLANLIPRFYDPTAGRVLIDGRDARHYTLKSLRASISIVTQEALLFSTSIRDNLRYARPNATRRMLWEALELANLRDFVEQLPAGINTIIGERGVKISGGQRQRLALARAFLKDALIVILDEATSAVDSEAENQIHAAIERLMRNRTVFLIAHRLRSAMNADLIVVLEDGSIVETGAHDQLVRRHNGVYAQLFREQAHGLSLDVPDNVRTNIPR